MKYIRYRVFSTSMGKYYTANKDVNVFNVGDGTEITTTDIVELSSKIFDVNDKEVFEGDIVNVYYNGDFRFKAVVKEDALNPCLVLEYKYNGDGFLCHEYDFIKGDGAKIEIVGNINFDTF